MSHSLVRIASAVGRNVPASSRRLWTRERREVAGERFGNVYFTMLAVTPLTGAAVGTIVFVKHSPSNDRFDRVGDGLTGAMVGGMTGAVLGFFWPVLVPAATLAYVTDRILRQ